jgi:chemotaxis signal transduction protein
MPLPDIIGAPATSWFDALVKLGDASVLLLAPQHLKPQAGRAPDREPPGLGPGLSADTGPPGEQAEPLVVLFSTAALPPSAARRYALSARQIAAIVQPLPVIAVPGSAGCITGVSWWRDAVVPVIDFRDPVARESAPHARCLLAQCGGRLRGTIVAVPIDSEVAVHKPAAADHRLDTPGPPFAAGMFSAAGEPVALLDLVALFDAPHWSPRTNNPDSHNGTPCTPSTMRRPEAPGDC